VLSVKNKITQLFGHVNQYNKQSKHKHISPKITLISGIVFCYIEVPLNFLQCKMFQIEAKLTLEKHPTDREKVCNRLL